MQAVPEWELVKVAQWRRGEPKITTDLLPFR